VYTYADVSYAELVSLGLYVAADDAACVLALTPDIIEGIRALAGGGDGPLAVTVVPMAGLWMSDGSCEPIYGFRIDLRRDAYARARGSGGAGREGRPKQYVGFSFGHASLPESAEWMYFIRLSYVLDG
jgi:hypothetical protein